MARAEVPGAIIPAVRLGRMVALTKPSGGVRALVMGDAFRRVVARTLAQQLHGPSVHVPRSSTPSAPKQARRPWCGQYGRPPRVTRGPPC